VARVYVTRDLPFDAVDRLRDAHEVTMWEDGTPPPREELLARAAESEGMLVTVTEAIDAELLDAAPDLRVVANLAVGTDNIDLAAAAERGVLVGNTPGVLNDTTADVAFALLLAQARRLAEGERQVREGEWGPWEPVGLLGSDVSSTTIGIVGWGGIAQAVARRAEGFDMEVLHHSRSSGIPLEELLERSDFVSLHTPLTDETRGLIGEAELQRMKPTAILVNTARGPVVDQAALTRALHEGWIAGAALDVTDPEPLPPEDPLLAAPNLLVIPHMGSATRRTRERMVELAVENILAALGGDAVPHQVEAP
jgi:glyoxylate reductase